MKSNKAVLLITIDALRADHLQLYNYHRNTTPNINKFSQKGTIFLNAFTNGPETPSSFSSIFTSVLPFFDGGYSPLPNQKITLPQLLSENGINTLCIHSNPNLGRFFNYDRGFNVFLDGERYKRSQAELKDMTFLQQLSFYVKKILNFKDLFRTLMFRLKGFNKIKSWLRNKIPLLTDVLLPFTPIAYNAPYIANKLTSFLSEINKPFFIWAHFMDVHAPYNPPTQNILNFSKDDISIGYRDFLTKKVYTLSKDIQITRKMIEDLKTLYDGEINFVDEFLGNVFRLLNDKIKNNCLVILTSDHGESFYEHGLFGHQGSVYEEALKIPIIVVEMGNKPVKKEIPDSVQLIDIAPTILDYFGITNPENFQGNSLLPLIDGEKTYTDLFIVSECYQKNRQIRRNHKEGFILLSIKKGEWKYIYDEENEKEYLFNLNQDPDEKVSLHKENNVIFEEFRMIRKEHIKNAVNSTEEKSRIIKAIRSLNINDIL